MADNYYYVSAQNGDDSNDGLTPETAWATLTKPTQTLGNTKFKNNDFVYFGPGTYREKITFITGGYSALYMMHYIPDPHCLHLIHDTPGRCRITGCDENEEPTPGPVINNNYKNYITFGSDEAICEVDGSSNDFVVKAYENWNIRQVIASGYQGLQGGGGSGTSKFFKCVALAQKLGFQYANVSYCLTLSGDAGYKQCLVHNSMAVGGYQGFSMCTVFSGYGVFNSFALHNYYGFNSVELFECSWLRCNQATVSCTLPGDGKAQQLFPRDNIELWDLRRLAHLGRGKGWWTVEVNRISNDNYRKDLSNDVIITNISIFRGLSKGCGVYISAKSSTGNITCELQEGVEDVWVTQKSKTLPVSALTNGRINRFEWDDGEGIRGTGFRCVISADEDAKSTELSCDSNYMPHFQTYILPDDAPETDIEGRPILNWDGYPCVGPWALPEVEVDWSIYKATAPGVRIKRKGMEIFDVVAKANEQITIKWWVRHTNTGSDKKPQIILRGLGITEQVATCTAASDTWQELSVTATPTRNGVLQCCLFARDTSETSYSVFSDPEVS